MQKYKPAVYARLEEMVKEEKKLCSRIHTIMFLQAVWTKKRAPAGLFKNKSN